jgi:death-on-curing protein
MEPVFLRLDQVLVIHQDQIERYGGSAGVRDGGMLLSAIAAPAATFGGDYLLGDLHEMAAAYLTGLVLNHPFVDGNKRVAAMTALAFLHMNGWQLLMPQERFADLVLDIAKGRIDRAGTAAILKQHSKRLR